MSKIYRGMLFNNECRFYLTNATDLVQEVNSKTVYSPTAIAALGRSMMVTNIMGLMLKDDSKVSTIINGHGPLGTIISTADSKGNVKAKVTNPLTDVPKINDTKLNVGAAVGKDGFLRVIKDLNLKEPFISEIPLVSGEIGVDYATYFSQSEQVPTAVAVGVLVGKDHSIKNASTFIVQLLPEASEETITKLETYFNSIKGISDEMENISEEGFLENNFKGDYSILEVIESNFECGCSYDKFLNALKLLPPHEIIQLREEKIVECNCDFCYKSYNIESKDI